MHSTVFRERTTRPEKGVIEGDRLIELHLYSGNLCNRECDFCTVLGSSRGWYHDYTADLLDTVLTHVSGHEQAAIKFYGGEPTLNTENVIWAIHYLREHHFKGSVVIYSNGIQAERLLQILTADPLHHTTASLNYSITTGDGAPQMPKQSLALLEAYELEHPGSIAIGHPDVVDAGRGLDPFAGESSRAKVSTRCPHCYPVLTTEGRFHACPFAVEIRSPHFDLGSVESSPAEVSARFKAFFQWLDSVHEPYAEQHGIPACRVCHHHLQKLPPFTDLGA